jgi:hypothetical protein
MARINTDQPSSGKPLLLYIPTATNSGFVNTTWTAIANAEAPDFSIPGSGDDGAVADPADADRELRPGEVFIESPLTVVNTTATTRWVEVRMLLQGTSGQSIPVTPRVPVPGGEAVYLPIQGLRLLKTDLTNTEPGGRLQIQAEVGNALTVIGTAVELEAADHAPDTEAP